MELLPLCEDTGWLRPIWQQIIVGIFVWFLSNTIRAVPLVVIF